LKQRDGRQAETCALLSGALDKAFNLMNPGQLNSDPEKPDDGLLSPEEFNEWMKNPANAEKFYKLVAEFNPPVPPDALPEVAAKLRSLADKRMLFLALAPVRRKLDALREVMLRPAGTMLAEDRMSQCRSLMEELTDALLELPQPHRTTHLKQLLSIREKIMAMKVD